MMGGLCLLPNNRHCCQVNSNHTETVFTNVETEHIRAFHQVSFDLEDLVDSKEKIVEFSEGES